MADNPPFPPKNQSIPISHRAFAIPLILANIFANIALERDVINCVLINRWWNQLASERLWYKFTGLKNDSKTNSFTKFLCVLRDSREGKCLHNYGRYVRILDLERLKLKHEILLETLSCCPRLEILQLRNIKLDQPTFRDIAERMPRIKSIKLKDIDINDGKAVGALAEFCHYLEDLSLKRDIECDGETLVQIMKNCPRITKLYLDQKPYEDEIMIEIFQYCHNLTFFHLDQCINVTEEFLVQIYRFCPKIEKLLVTNIYEVSNEFVLETARFFKDVTMLSVTKVERLLDCRVEADKDKIEVHIVECQMGRIVDFFSNRKRKLEILMMTGIEMNKMTLGLTCDRLDLSVLNLDKVSGVKKQDILDSIPKLKNLTKLYVLFQTYSLDPLLDDEKQRIKASCPSLKFIDWHRVRYELVDDPAYKLLDES